MQLIVLHVINHQPIVQVVKENIIIKINVLHNVLLIIMVILNLFVNYVILQSKHVNNH